MDKSISRRIEKSRENLDKKSQRAELLIRNDKFQEEFNNFIDLLPDASKFFSVKKISPEDADYYSTVKQCSKGELQKISKDNILIKIKYTKYKSKYWIEKQDKYFKYLAEAFNENEIIKSSRKPDKTFEKMVFLFGRQEKYRAEIEHRFNAFKEHLKLWKSFCDRWFINYEWEGKLENVYKFQRSPVEIYYNDHVAGRNDFKDKSQWVFLLRFNAWTTLEDIKDRWGSVEKIQKIIFGKPERKANFSRDLCWYDLYKKHNLSPKQIAELWIEECPEDIDLLVIRRIKGLIKKAINKDERLKEFRGWVFNDDELLKEIKSGKLTKKLKGYYDFNKEKEDYINGKYPPFIDTIKKAIRRMEKQIMQLIYPQPEGVDFLFIKRAKSIDNKLLISLY